ncbi:ABC transporter permease subunit [Natronobacterium texcoconense]|uniref:ABC-type transport system involved in multi-copper enzyme maturation, permease component n=1 Tax=Natronobacterium texcoconense TaxID=1095778 RepID=A0A1H1IDK4_NATTX|nr:ABC transporter permease subunit [Natronobacterium texcoconense]SDR35406.1 ABC-type transport system involved in multi-copper enzyme maturation, permease component [Natronobacterium texcoconense]
MRWLPLAREECKALLSTKGVWLLALALPLWTYRPDYTAWAELGPDMTIGFVQYSAAFLLPIAAIALGYQTIVGERTSGSLQFVLGLPLTRGDVLLGKLVGLTVGIAIPMLLALGLVTLVGVVRFGLFSPLRYLAVILVTLAYLAVLVSIVVSVSALAGRAATAAVTLFVGLFLLLEFLWQMLSPMLYSRLTGTPVDPYDPPAEGGLFLLDRLSPGGAYNTVTNGILDTGNSAWHYSSVLSEIQPNVSSNALVVDTAFDPGTVPLYLHEAGGLVILAAWGLVPLGIAYLRFDRGDLV